ncbi:helix-turn-helix transcriptional regulator [Salinispora arenicola]|uniref:helix-turn-helix transcriptional regulator n=1 Tax=Salinispora arenicola TaxID=168697 RepID=UPI00036CA4B1|nr:helix-turn-helix transcriptional regulator [Salinispora arenicola]MCN0153383.1 helix-turn-helix domain-containing protein [Salinispora arenicola]
MNERLRTVMVRRGVAVEDLADECGVDPKTVERWISSGRVPHRRHRWTAARRLGAEEAYLWPEALESVNSRRGEASRAELIEVYPDRASVSREVWLRLLTEAQERIDVLVFSGTFFAQTQPRVTRMLADRLSVGVQVRLCFGDPSSDAVMIRDREEGLGGTLGAKIRASLTYYRELAGVDGCEIRLHPTTLYTSLFRYDDEILVNPHAYGEAASANPTFHFRRVDGGGLFEHYTASFDRVWATAVPWLGTEV